MEKVKEVYVSYELAKLLKEKGFNVATEYVYLGDNKGKIAKSFTSNFVRKRNDIIPCPTHQVACAWIRSKGYSVEVHATAGGWNWEVCKVNGTSIAFGGTIPSDNTNEGRAFNDYYECMENALKYCLENLI